MEAAHSSETSVNCWNTRRIIPDICEAVNTEVEGSTVLEAITRQRLVN
jgi:hypothetical protein